MRDKGIAILGLGTIGMALAAGILRASLVPKERLAGTTAHPETAREVQERLGITVTTDNRALAREADLLILAVKPKTVPKVLLETRDVVSPRQVLISVAAATPTSLIEEVLDRPIPVVRAMPNIPSQIGQGMTGICAGRYAKAEHLELAKAIFGTVGRVALIEEEELMDAVTALSGSGPAYACLIIEALSEGGVKMGLPRKLATELAAQALLGGAALVLASGEHPALLKDEVTTPAGVTIDGLMALEAGGLRVALIKAVMAATARGKALGRVLSSRAMSREPPWT
ncbi:pyrroline-5-carboxylate reductase [Candidatus Bipolaricaulota bacterium]|nr:pyrroline-5-carboxylate reductase [Candidatus Bipolaricaulota bacterium]